MLVEEQATVYYILSSSFSKKCSHKLSFPHEHYWNKVLKYNSLRNIIYTRSKKVVRLKALSLSCAVYPLIQPKPIAYISRLDVSRARFHSLSAAIGPRELSNFPSGNDSPFFFEAGRKASRQATERKCARLPHAQYIRAASPALWRVLTRRFPSGLIYV